MPPERDIRGSQLSSSGRPAMACRNAHHPKREAGPRKLAAPNTGYDIVGIARRQPPHTRL
jgi:hypothetical protein